MRRPALNQLRDGVEEELDLNGTIRATAEYGYLDVKTRPERRDIIWFNPVSEKAWRYTQSTQMIMKLFGGRMFPLTLNGLDAGLKELS